MPFPKEPVFGPVVTAMATPFVADGGLDLPGAATLVRHLTATGTDTVLLAGTTGESPTLHGEETWELLRAVRDELGPDGRIMVGTGSNDTRHALEMTERATKDGADAVLVVTPYYNKPDARGMAAHFTAVAEATDLPVLLYDIPGRTSREIPLEVLVALAGIDNVAGVKDATGDLVKAAQLVAATAELDFVVYSGGDEVTLPLLSVGAVGVVSVASHLIGPRIAEMVEVFPTDPARSAALHRDVLSVWDPLFAEPSPAPLKAGLAHLGLPAGPVRPPLAPASAGVSQRIGNVLDRLGVTS